MTKARLNRLFASDGRCLDVAIDHGLFNEPSLVVGAEDMPHIVAELVAGHPDAIQLSAGQARLLQTIADPAKPALVLRTDVANVYGRGERTEFFSEIIGDPVGEAVRLDAACVVVNLMLVPGHPGIHKACIRNIVRLKPACERYGMPLMIESLVMRPDNEVGSYLVDGDAAKIVSLVRQAVELGADVIKADPTDEVDEYVRVVQAAAGRPVLVRGGGLNALRSVLERTERFVALGASGVVYGRNVFQATDPVAMALALLDIVHSRITASQAIERLSVKSASN